MSIWQRLATLGDSLLSAGQPLRDLVSRLVGGDPSAPGQAPRDGTESIAFTIAVVSLAAKMAKADDVVLQREVDAFEAIFHVPDSERPAVMRVFRLAQQSTAGYDSYARQVARLLADNVAALEQVLDALFHIAAAEGKVATGELEFLREVARLFGFSEADFQRIAAENGVGLAENPYIVLGLSPDATQAEIRAAYRRLLLRNHPDALQAAGVPADMLELAQEKTRRIVAAYRRLSGERNAMT
ncbi:MAG: molecular chaperone DjiA [Alphaproteobacteria bacterium]|nr:molecular chaperone DjiA [Alphaproteobacteria bacterium]